MAAAAEKRPCFLVPGTALVLPAQRRASWISRKPCAASVSRRQRPRCAFESGTGGAVRNELELVSALVGGGGARAGLSVTAREKVELAAQVLETGANGAAVAFPDDLTLLDGAWTLLYSSEINSVPPAATAVRQRFAVEDRRVENCICLALGPPRLPGNAPAIAGEVVIGANFDVVNKDTITLTLIDVQLRVQEPLGDRLRDLTPRLPLPDWRFPPFTREAVRGTSKDVRTTYYGEEIRVARSSGGELRIFCRQT